MQRCRFDPPVERIFPFESTWVLTPFPLNSFGLCTHAFHGTDSKDPDIHVLDEWMPATKTHPACTIHKECDYLNGWIKKWSHTQKSHPKWWAPEIWLGNAEEEMVVLVEVEVIKVLVLYAAAVIIVLVIDVAAVEIVLSSTCGSTGSSISCFLVIQTLQTYFDWFFGLCSNLYGTFICLHGRSCVHVCVCACVYAWMLMVTKYHNVFVFFNI